MEEAFVSSLNYEILNELFINTVFLEYVYMRKKKGRGNVGIKLNILIELKNGNKNITRPYGFNLQVERTFIGISI